MISERHIGMMGAGTLTAHIIIYTNLYDRDYTIFANILAGEGRRFRPYAAGERRDIAAGGLTPAP